MKNITGNKFRLIMESFKININPNAPVKCSKSIVINAKPEKVWSILTDINNWSNWQKDISKSKLNDSLQVNSTFEWKTGGAKIHSTLHTVEPFTRLGWTGRTMGMYAIHNWTLTDNDGKTRVEVEESMEGFLASVLKFMFNKNLEKSIGKWLELLKKECEK
jgi:uncharacterized protein YndB with AHSA1/START domain